jgi:hypothetical protein
MRTYVEDNQEIGRMHVQMLTATDPGAEPSAEASAEPTDEPSDEPDMEALTALVTRAVGGPELPDYDGVPDSRPPYRQSD